MKTHDLIGRKIIRIEQYRMKNNANQIVSGLGAIVLDNGTQIAFTVGETESQGYIVEGLRIDRPQRERNP